MTGLGEARVRVVSARARHERLCAAFDRGEPVVVALGLAYRDWVRARDRLAVLEHADADGTVAAVLLQAHNADAPGDLS